MNGSGDEGLVHWLVRIESKVDQITGTIFTKQDMESFKRDVCFPSREGQRTLEERVRRSEKFQARMGGIIAAVSVIWGILIVFLNQFKG